MMIAGTWRDKHESKRITLHWVTGTGHDHTGAGTAKDHARASAGRIVAELQAMGIASARTGRVTAYKGYAECAVTVSRAAALQTAAVLGLGPVYAHKPEQCSDPDGWFGDQGYTGYIEKGHSETLSAVRVAAVRLVEKGPMRGMACAWRPHGAGRFVSSGDSHWKWDGAFWCSQGRRDVLSGDAVETLYNKGAGWSLLAEDNRWAWGDNARAYWDGLDIDAPMRGALIRYDDDGGAVLAVT